MTDRKRHPAGNGREKKFPVVESLEVYPFTTAWLGGRRAAPKTDEHMNAVGPTSIRTLQPELAIQ
jgi:hypothetical protein